MQIPALPSTFPPSHPPPNNALAAETRSPSSTETASTDDERIMMAYLEVLPV